MKSDGIKKIACLGAGSIGTSWVVLFAMKGYPVSLCDVSGERLNMAKESIARSLHFLFQKQIISEVEFKKALSLVTYTTDYKEGFTGADFVQESGPENYEIKQTILKEIEQYVAADTIIASSTSGLLISEIAKEAEHPERCIGAHPYNPAYIIPLVELTKSEYTTDEVIENAKTFYQLLGKEPVVLQKETMGFIANRLQAGLFREAVELVRRGVCTVEDVDKATVFGPGIRWASIGMALTLEVNAVEGGLSATAANLEDSWNMWFDDMADWHKYPEGWVELFQKGVREEMAHRDSDSGRTREEIIAFRDDCLLEILKLHKKL